MHISKFFFSILSYPKADKKTFNTTDDLLLYIEQFTYFKHRISIYLWVEK